jgi:regulator of protease activity HflC (stomatin/prohibitin superfamily)
MVAQQTTQLPPSDPYQLSQVKVPIDDADDAFTMRDSSGRIPIVIVPTHPNRIRNDFVLAGVGVLIAGIVAGSVYLPRWTIVPAAVIGAVLLGMGIFRSFLVRVPEGTQALLARGGKHTRTIGSGSYVVPPWIAVSHLVTRREIPFDVPVIEAPTRDAVRVGVDILLTFSVEAPFRFVFNISTDDFDHVLQASCQEALRSMIRRVNVEEVLNFTGRDTDDLREMIDPDVEPYGVRIRKIKITFSQPPPDFMRSQEERQLAVLQREEQAEKQALAERRQADEDVLERQRLLARNLRELDELQIQMELADAQKQLVALNAEAEALRLEKLEERIRSNPLAAQYDVESARLDVARDLARNSRAVLQIGKDDDISQVLLMHETLREAAVLADTVPVVNQAAHGAKSPRPDSSEAAKRGSEE